MLRFLDIRDVLIIDRLELEFQPGLNVLTGETGAGKSILLDSLGFVLGWRGRAELVRKGADQGEVTASFDLAADHPAWAILDEAGFDRDDELILRRVNTKDGRKTAWINGRRAPGEVLRQVSDTLIELHGQHDDRGLLNARGHRALLDAFADAGAPRAACRDAWRQLRDATKELAAIQDRIAAAAEEEDFLRHAVAELDALAPEVGEEAQLDAKRRLMQASEKIRTDIVHASQALGLQGAEGQITDAMRWLDGANPDIEDRLAPSLDALERILADLDVAQRGVQDCIAALSFNSGDLEDAEERLFAIRGLARKHNVLPDDLATLAGNLRAKLHELDAGEQALSAQQQAVAKAQKAYDKEADQLHKLRVKMAKQLDGAMAAELAPLKMERAIFKTNLDRGEPGPDGYDDVSFSVAPNPGSPSGPLNKIASGGELSRFLLALKVCLSKGDTSSRTMIFDEIDRGVGGATAAAVGRRLADLAAHGQVLVVTHSPQVAAMGAHHWRVEKQQSATATLSTVVPLNSETRIEEIARMLSGDSVTKEALAAARALISD